MVCVTVTGAQVQSLPGPAPGGAGEAKTLTRGDTFEN